MFEYNCSSPRVAAGGDRLRHTKGHGSCILTSPLSDQGVSVLGGKCPGGKCPGRKCPGGLCPWGKCPGGKCPGGFCPRTVISKTQDPQFLQEKCNVSNQSCIIHFINLCILTSIPICAFSPSNSEINSFI